MNSPGTVKSNGTGYVGKAHRKPAGASLGNTKASMIYPTVDAAIEAAGRTIHVAGAKLVATWPYTDSTGKEVMQVARFDLPDGSKEFRPVHRTKAGWKIGDPPCPHPLYRLNEIPPAGMVWVCEGEKATDAAHTIGLAAVTSAHGSSAAHKTDWTPLAGRDVCILPDNDEAGRQYAQDVAAKLVKLELPARVKIVPLPGLPDGGDIVQYIEGRDSQGSEATAKSISAVADAVDFIPPADLIGGPLMVCLADVEARDIDWLWPGRVALGCITLLVANPGEGKGLTTCDMAARITTGRPWPDGSHCPKGSVILISGEDDPNTVIRPRMNAHHANVSQITLLSMVRHIREGGKLHDARFTLADLPALETTLKAHRDCKLIVVDPIGSFIGGRTDAHRDNEVRDVLAPVAKLAETYGAAVLIVMHRRKSGGTSADDTALGSRAFTGIARAVWHLSTDPQNAERRLLLPGKNNLGPKGDGLAFTFEGEDQNTAIVWEPDPVAMSADDALAVANASVRNGPGRPAKERSKAIEWLESALADNEEHSVSKLEDDAQTAGITRRTIQRASEKLGVVKSRNKGFGSGGTWCLPKPDHAAGESENSGANGTNGKIQRNSAHLTVPESHSCQNVDIGKNDDASDDQLAETPVDVPDF